MEVKEKENKKPGASKGFKEGMQISSASTDVGGGHGKKEIQVKSKEKGKR